MNKYMTDRRSSLNSLNGLQMQPVAESTCLHLNNSNSRSFTWGFTSISPKQRSNSACCLTNADETNRRHNYTNTSIYTTQRRKCEKIDPKIYADVKSRGLAARIVKYHEGGGISLNRSSSLRNLCSKPGQFPVVNLRKSELPLRATRQPLSMTRIAPPQNTVFQGTTLSSLLRSNSVINVHKPEEHGERSKQAVSCENRPIMHPPPTESESAPTRSVLEKLKEISRKRINNEDLNANETNKKYCNCNDFVDAGWRPSPIETSSTSKPAIKNHKRQRDTSSAQIELTNTALEHSPPDQAKKRQCNYNNDISSSLSSSMNYRTKMAKLTEPNRTSLSQPDASVHQWKQQQPSNLEENVEKIPQDFNEPLAPITPLPTTPLIQDHQKPEAVPPNRTLSAPTPLQSNRTTTGMESKIEVKSKPRLTLFNKNYAEAAYDNTAASSEDDSVAQDAKCIQFIKPKKLSAFGGAKNPLIEKTQKSKLALMLSGLRGELYLENDYDQVDSKQTKKYPELQAAASSTENTELVKATTSVSIPIATASNVTTSITNKDQEASVPSTNPNVITSTMTNKFPLIANQINLQTPAAPHTESAAAFVNPTGICTTSIPVFSATKASTTTSAITTVSNNTQSKQPEGKTVASTITTATTSAATTTTPAPTNTLLATSSGTTIPPQLTPAPDNAFNLFATQTANSNPGAQAKPFAFATNATNKLVDSKHTEKATATSSSATTFKFPVTATTPTETIKPILVTTTSVSTPISSSSSSIQKPLFAFGNSVTFPTDSTNTSNASTPFGFAFNTANATITSKTEASVVSITVTKSMQVTGFSSNLSNTFKFGATTTINSVIANNANNTFTFGNNTQLTQSTEAKTTSFNSQPIAGNKEQPVFGLQAAGIFASSTAQEPSKSTTSSVFAFGMKTTQPSTTGGFSFAASNNSGFFFGGTNTNANANQASASNIAGNTTFSSLAATNADQKKMFSFGNNAADNRSLQLFGQHDNTKISTTVADTANNSGGFSFANASNPTPATTTSGSSIFTFGTANNSTQPAKDNSIMPAKPFTFSGSGSGVNQSGLSFGAANALNKADVSVFLVDKNTNQSMTQAPVFNFGAAPANNLQPNNIFAAATNQKSINERPIRRATRRLQKS